MEDRGRRDALRSDAMIHHMRVGQVNDDVLAATK